MEFEDISSTQIRENIKQNHIELGVPFDSDKAEILIFKYKEEDGMPKAIHILNQCTYFNITYKFFTTPGYLNIADSECIYSFGLHELKRIITVNEYYCILGIDRDEVFRYERFPKNEVSRNTARDLNLREYHILEIERNGETYGLYFPTYELNFFEWITGLTA
ncbi:MAG: hypothetical protein J6V36_03195, partial [Clostridia bacterium]|nr:hypothetical protein [Clostridia bacterium]